MRNRRRVNLVAIAKLYTMRGISSQPSDVKDFLNTPPFDLKEREGVNTRYAFPRGEPARLPAKNCDSVGR
jgi:hypothetical protein